MRSQVLRWVGLAVTVAVALLILSDATSNNLLPRDAVTGRMMGCYTSLELMFGTTHPTWWGRPVEWAAGLTLMIFAGRRSLQLFNGTRTI